MSEGKSRRPFRLGRVVAIEYERDGETWRHEFDRRPLPLATVPQEGEVRIVGKFVLSRGYLEG